MDRSDVFRDTPELDYDSWREDLFAGWGTYRASALYGGAFRGRIRHRKLFGLVAMDFTCNAPVVERTRRDARSDSREHYYAAIQLAGGSAIVRDDQSLAMRVGDIALVDSARPVTFAGDEKHQYGQWFCLQLPRRSLISHIGFEPDVGAYGRRETRPARLFDQLVVDYLHDASSLSTPSDLYMHLAVYDLLGALFAPSDVTSVSLHTDKLFSRICRIIRGRFRDPDLTPSQVAMEAGLSLRYLQKLFTARGLTYSHYLQSVRLDHAALLLERRAVMKSGQPLAMVAYDCGFRDYTYFARGYRRRFGHVPGRTGARSPEDGVVRTSPGGSAR
jgi:AraC family transcriptional regulator, positive regulator of tynA and feaB